MRTAATYIDVINLVEAGRLRVSHGGIVETRRLHRNGNLGPWHVTAIELVHPPKRTKRPYARVCICGFRCLVHRLVWFVLRGSIPDGLQINHINGDKLDNRLGNLEVVTAAENLAHAAAHGLIDPRAPKNWSLTADQVREIRKRTAAGESQIVIARAYTTTANVINRLLKGKTYRSVT